MLVIKILSLYPELFNSFLSESILSRAIREQHLDIEVINFRKHGIGKHLKVDDTPYGGGAGMVLRPEPLIETLEECKTALGNEPTETILITPQGRPFTQSVAKKLAEQKKCLILICGRFEGFDQRIRTYVDQEISLGDFILLGGEVAAMAIIEAVSRLQPGVLGNRESLVCESFEDGLLECDQYTRPHRFRGMEVPSVLLSGDHGKIAEWRHANSLTKTRLRRPDLLIKESEKETL